MSNFSKKKYFLITAIIFVIAVGVFGLARPAGAGLAQGVVQVLGWLLYPFIILLGKLIILLINLLISVAQYNDFINATAVVKGWMIIRDIANMCFIIVLMFIALCTVMKIEAYSYKKFLPLLIIMAILINFSRTICGIIIDAGQVMMMTFVNAFKDTAAGNFTHALRIHNIMAFRDTLTGEELGALNVASSVILALIIEIVALIVMFIMLLVLVARIAMLWILTVVSPFVFLAHALPIPIAQSYANRWWQNLWKYVLIGPILAFFIWLALTVAAVTPQMSDELHVPSVGKEEFEKKEGVMSAAVTGIGQSDTILSFIICIAFLMGGLMVTQQMGVVGGALAGKAVGKIQQAPGKVTKKVAKEVGKFAATRRPARAVQTWAGTQRERLKGAPVVGALFRTREERKRLIEEDIAKRKAIELAKIGRLSEAAMIERPIISRRKQEMVDMREEEVRGRLERGVRRKDRYETISALETLSGRGKMKFEDLEKLEKIKFAPAERDKKDLMMKDLLDTNRTAQIKAETMPDKLITEEGFVRRGGELVKELTPENIADEVEGYDFAHLIKPGLEKMLAPQVKGPRALGFALGLRGHLGDFGKLSADDRRKIEKRIEEMVKNPAKFSLKKDDIDKHLGDLNEIYRFSKAEFRAGRLKKGESDKMDRGEYDLPEYKKKPQLEAETVHRLIDNLTREKEAINRGKKRGETSLSVRNRDFSRLKDLTEHIKQESKRIKPEISDKKTKLGKQFDDINKVIKETDEKNVRTADLDNLTEKMDGLQDLLAREFPKSKKEKK